MLILLALLALLVLHSPLHGFEPANRFAGLVQRGLKLLFLGIGCVGRSFSELPLDVVDSFLDVALPLRRVLEVPVVEQFLALVHLVNQAAGFDRVGGGSDSGGGLAAFRRVLNRLETFLEPLEVLESLFLLLADLSGTLLGVVLRVGRKPLGFLGDSALLLGEFASLLLQVGQPLVKTSTLGIRQHPLGPFQLFHGTFGSLLLLLAATAGRLLHVAGRLLQGPTHVGHLTVVVLPGKLLQISGKPFGLPAQFLGGHLLASSTPAAGRGLTPLLLHHLLLACGEFLELTESLLHFLLLVLGQFAALKCLVLVLVLVQFQIKEVGEVFGALATTSTTSTAAAHRHLDLIEQGFGPHEVLQRLLLER